LENVGAVRVEILSFLLTWHIAYTRACCYRTSRDYFLSRRPMDICRILPLRTIARTYAYITRTLTNRIFPTKHKGLWQKNWL